MDISDHDHLTNKLTIGRLITAIFNADTLSINELENSVEKLLKLIIQQHQIKDKLNLILHLDLNFYHGYDKLKFNGRINDTPVIHAANQINHEYHTTLKNLSARQNSMNNLEGRMQALQLMDHMSEISTLPSPKCHKCASDCYMNAILCLRSIAALEENKSVSIVCPTCLHSHTCDNNNNQKASSSNGDSSTAGDNQSSSSEQPVEPVVLQGTPYKPSAVEADNLKPKSEVTCGSRIII